MAVLLEILIIIIMIGEHPVWFLVIIDALIAIHLYTCSTEFIYLFIYFYF